MADREVTVGYSDGTHKTMPVRADQTVVDAAEEHGVAIVSECQSGICGTCVATCTAGQYEMGRTEGLSDVERDARKILTCQTFATSDCRIELQYPADDNAARLTACDGVVTGVDMTSPSTAMLRVKVSPKAGALSYQAGQFAQLQVPGTNTWRNYSYAHPADGSGELEFIIRLLPDGVMSNYLRDRARSGDHIAMRCSKGTFGLRPVVRPVVLVAGGTGLSAILAMAQSLPADTAHPVSVLYGVTSSEDLCKLDELDALAERVPAVQVHVIVAQPNPGWNGPTGLVTDLLNEAMLSGGDADVYLCGPARMVEATRTWLDSNGFHRVGLYYEKFVPSGAARRRSPVHLDHAAIDIADVRRRGRGTAVVIGGSIAGIAAAKVLTETFDRVIVLEKDDPHRRREGRPGAAQGWHLHHLLTTGQIELERFFPGIVDDMVREGVFKVDTAAHYRIRLGGSWKKPGTSDIEIVCAGRPLLEWCVRRRLDDEPRIDFRYESEVGDLVYDRANNAIVGVAVGKDGDFEVVPAEFVVDASGKNTRVPDFLDRISIGAPEVEQDIINCFYSTMQHRVPPERQWQDKVMVICYAYRPYEDTYAAQYYTDSTRTILSTSLVAYNCYSPPRIAREFREFADLMPSPVVGENIDGLEPASPIYNFRYPNHALVALRAQAAPAAGAAGRRRCLHQRRPGVRPGDEPGAQGSSRNAAAAGQIRPGPSRSAAPLLQVDRQDGPLGVVRDPRTEFAVRLDERRGQEASLLFPHTHLVHGSADGIGARRPRHLSRVPGRPAPRQTTAGADDARNRRPRHQQVGADALVGPTDADRPQLRKSHGAPGRHREPACGRG